MNVKDILTRYKIHIVNENTDEIRCLCPFHNDQNSSFSINKKSGLWKCFAGCGSGNLNILIFRLSKYNNLKLENNDTLKEIQERLNYFKDNNNISKFKIMELPFAFYKYKNINQCPKHLLNRIKWKTIKFFELGECKQKEYLNRIIIPIKFKNKYVGFTSRDYSGNSKYKYLHPKNWQIKKYVYGYDNINFSKRFKKLKEIIIVEGPFDVMSLYEKGFKNVVATFGAFTNHEQLKLFIDLGAKNLVYCYDNDKAGRAGLYKVKKYCYMFKKISYVLLPEKKDPNNLTKKDFIYYFKQKKYWKCYT